jgi:uncharacterized cofD-like protein
MGERNPEAPAVNVVVIGGGTGNSTVLSGLRHYVGEGLTAIVNTFDDGGGTGELRDKYPDLAAVGDIRQCVMAMSGVAEEARTVLGHRFLAEGIKGQTLGNLMITAAWAENGGNLGRAVTTLAELFQVKGRVLPASNDNLRLTFNLPDGRRIIGEHTAEETKVPSLKGTVIGFDNCPSPEGSEAAEAAILAADMVVYAPGDLYTSIGPVLNMPGIAFALRRTAGVIQVSNLMNRDRHTVGFTTLDYAKEYDRFVGAKVIDATIYNTGQLEPAALAEQVEKGSRPVRHDADGMHNAGYEAIGKDMLSREKIVHDELDPLDNRSDIRHDPDKVARAIMGLYFANGFGGKVAE